MSKLKTFEVGEGFILGMVHCLALPGAPRYDGDVQAIIDQAVADAKALAAAGVDGVIVENMGDDPFAECLDKAQITALSVVAANVRAAVDLPIGIDAAMNDYETAISLALAVGGDFVRLPVFVDTVQFYGCGTIEPCARGAMYYRKALGAEHIMVFADIHVKHTHQVLPHVKIEDSAVAAEACGADAIIVTGTRIGAETPIDLIRRVKQVANVPVIAASGVTTANIAEQLTVADGVIVGSGLKDEGVLTNPISYELTRALVAARDKE